MQQAATTAPARLADDQRPTARRRRPRATVVLGLLIAGLAVVAVLAVTIGAAGIPLSRLSSAFGIGAAADAALLARDKLVLWAVRIPRIVATAAIGAMLALSGTVMQGLFRNPLADPALVGVASGGALGAALTIVLLDAPLIVLPALGEIELLPFAAFVGALVTTWALYLISSWRGRTSIAVFLLAGLAVAALTNAGTGLLVFLADDRQLRDITFWMLGSVSGATWGKTVTLLPALVAGFLAMPFIARGLDLLVLGEAEAFHSGINVQVLKTLSIVVVSAMTGFAVSISGVIGFVGIIVPHLLRIAIGPGHRLLLPASALGGAMLLIGADTLARTLAAPAEVPIGILTAAVGAPFFLFLLLRQRALVAL